MNSTSDLQIWDNAAFDNSDFDVSILSLTKSSWCPVKPVTLNQADSLLDSDSTKENQSPVLAKSTSLIKPLHPNGAIGGDPIIKTTGKPLVVVAKHGVRVSNESQESVRDEKKIDTEIEEIEKELSRLSSRLQVLKLEKAEGKVKFGERRVRVNPAKFMEQKQSNNVKISEDIVMLSAKEKGKRRGVNMGPGDFVIGEGGGGRSRGLSVGPSEIVVINKQRQLGSNYNNKLEITPVQPMSSRRKSCFWKLQGIDEEEKEGKGGRGGGNKSLSLSPKSRKALCKSQGGFRHAATTVGLLRKGVKKDDAVLSLIQPKKIFKDGEKSVIDGDKKCQKPGRVVASRYNQSTIQSALRKRSLPENDKDASKRGDKKRVPSETIRSLGSESRVKKKWEVPSEIVVCGNLEEAEKCQPSVCVLPRIRTVRRAVETPRDSGPAKRVAELIGRKSYFCSDGDVEGGSVCQTLSFAEEDFEEEQDGN